MFGAFLLSERPSPGIEFPPHAREDATRTRFVRAYASPSEATVSVTVFLNRLRLRGLHTVHGIFGRPQAPRADPVRTERVPSLRSRLLIRRPPQSVPSPASFATGSTRQPSGATSSDCMSATRLRRWDPCGFWNQPGALADGFNCW
jgi:hypothetical protein